MSKIQTFQTKMVKKIQNSRLFQKSAIWPDFLDQPALMCIQNQMYIHWCLRISEMHRKRCWCYLNKISRLLQVFEAFPDQKKNPWCIQVFQNPYNPEEAIDGFYLFWFNPKALDPAKRNDQIKKYVVINKQVVCSHQNIKIVSEVY